MVRTDRGGLASESRADNPHGVESICRFAGRDAPRTPTARSGGVVDARKEIHWAIRRNALAGLWRLQEDRTRRQDKPETGLSRPLPGHHTRGD
jgi:hypothetical protein